MKSHTWTTFATVLACAASAAGAPAPISNDQWPYGPLSTSGRDIVNGRNETVKWAGVNWPGHLETMIPEGLEWQSAEDILDSVAGVGFNFIRFTYAIEQINEIYIRNGSDVPLEVAMIQGLGYENGTKVTQQIIAKNPTWNATTTRFEIWDHITRVAAEKQIYIHPDVHVNDKAGWCCSHTDGSAWFGDLNFNTTYWIRGLQYVAEWAKGHPNVVSMALHNELRESWNVTSPPGLVYNWETLVGNMTAGTSAIHDVNPDLLVSWSGMQYDQDLSALTTGLNLLTAPCYKCTAIRDAADRDPVIFDLDSYPWANKLFWELHLYDGSEDLDTSRCDRIEQALYRNGYNSLGMESPNNCSQTPSTPETACLPPARLTPVVMTEFGHAQDESLYNATLQNCLKNYTLKHEISWAVWALAGSYRIRSGSQGLPDTWGLTNFNWTGWNYAPAIEDYWKPWVAATLGQ